MAQARRWADEGVEFVQLREKQLAAGELVRLAAAMLAGLREVGGKTADQVRRVFATAGAGKPVVSVSCHTLAEVRRAVAGCADLILFGPVFEKCVLHPNGQRTPIGGPGAGVVVVAGVGLERLREACAAAGGTPVLALGGVSWESAGLCVEAGAAGVAGIRLFGTEAAGEAQE
jgi:thiamine-phosphate pyrophosphorylase